MDTIDIAASNSTIKIASLPLRLILIKLISKHGWTTITDTLVMLLNDEHPDVEAVYDLESALRKLEIEGL